MDERWVVGSVLVKTEAGAVLWCKLGVFTDRGLAASWARYTGANLLMQVASGVQTPLLGEFGVSVVQQVQAGE
jgi:hypothetical protein